MTIIRKFLFIWLIFTVVIVMPALAEVNITTLADGSTKFSNGTYWITWEPIGSHVVGDTFFVNGTTNLSLGTKLYFTYMAENWDTCHTKICKGSYYSTLDGLATVKSRADASPNTLSILINTTNFKSDNYYLIFGMYSSNFPAESDAFAGPGGLRISRALLLSPATLNATSPIGTAPPTSKRAAIPTILIFYALLGCIGVVIIRKKREKVP